MTYPLILVEWIDAMYNYDHRWDADGGTLKPCLIKTPGYLLHVEPSFLRIATDQLEDLGDNQTGWGKRHAFPREMVKKVTLLETGAAWEWPE